MSAFDDECGCCKKREVFVQSTIELREKTATRYANGVNVALISTTPAHGLTGRYKLVTLTENFIVVKSGEPDGSCTRVTEYSRSGDDYTSSPPGAPDVEVTSDPCAEADGTLVLDDSSITTSAKLDGVVEAAETAAEAAEYTAWTGIALGSGIDASPEGDPTSATAHLVEFRPGALLTDSEGDAFDGFPIDWVGKDTETLPEVDIDWVQNDDVAGTGVNVAGERTLVYRDGFWEEESEEDEGWEALPVLENQFSMVSVGREGLGPRLLNYTGVFWFE